MRDEYAPAISGRVPGDASRLGLQAAARWRGLTRLCDLHGRSWCVVHHPPPGACLGSAAGERAAGPLGQPAHLRTPIRALSQRDRSAHANSGTGAAAIQTEASEALFVFGRRDQAVTIYHAQYATLAILQRPQRLRAVASGLLLSIWAAQRLRSPPGRSAQSKASRRRSGGRGLDDPRHQIW